MIRRLNILNHTGHTEILFSNDPKEQIGGVMSVEEAERAFGDFTHQGYRAENGEQFIRSLGDEPQRDITMHPAIVGG